MSELSRTLSTLAILLLLPACVASGAGRTDSVGHQGRNRYLYCNVFQDEACFGISAGDELRMSIPSDFVRYDIKLGSGLSGVVYFGANPRISDTVLRKEFEDCIEGSLACSFVHFSKPLSAVEAIYSGDRQHDFVHVVLSGVSESNTRLALEFLENFRACERIRSSLRCEDDGIFSSAVK